MKEAGETWIQFDEPSLVMDLEAHYLNAFSNSYSFLKEVLVRTKLLVETYFADIPVETYYFLEEVLVGTKLLVESYFADIPVETYR